jgi:hypothetical protein
MFDYDLDDGVMLLEWLDHTTNLDTLPIDEAIIVAGTLRARLSLLAPMAIRTLPASAERWVEEMREVPVAETDRRRGSGSLPRPRTMCEPSRHSGRRILHDQIHRRLHRKPSRCEHVAFGRRLGLSHIAAEDLDPRQWHARRREPPTHRQPVA